MTSIERATRMNSTPQNGAKHLDDKALVLSSPPEVRLADRPQDPSRDSYQPAEGIDAALGDSYSSQGKHNVHSCMETLRNPAEMQNFLQSLEPQDIKLLFESLAKETCNARFGKDFSMDEKLKLSHDLQRIILGL